MFYASLITHHFFSRLRSPVSLFHHSSLTAASLFLVVLVTPLLPQDAGEDTVYIEDAWLAFDKVQHVTFSFLWVLSVQYVAVNKLDMAEKEAFPVSLTTSAFAGLLKEIYDSRKPGGRLSKRDMVANGVGLFLASAVVLSQGKK